MPRGLIAHLHRRPIAMLAAGVIALQAFLAGLAGARAAQIFLADPLGIAIICHGAVSANRDDGAPPPPINERHLCCVACMSGSAAATLPQHTVLVGFESWHGATRFAVCAADVPIADRAIRAGESRAPPPRR